VLDISSSPTLILLYVATHAVLWSALGWFMIRSLRRKSYRSWRWPARWLFFAIVGLFVYAGGYALLMHFARTWGWPATIWFIGAPAAWGLWEGFQSDGGSAPASPPASQSGAR